MACPPLKRLPGALVGLVILALLAAANAGVALPTPNSTPVVAVRVGDRHRVANVAVLQAAKPSAPTDRFPKAQALMKEAAGKHARIAVLPEGWEDSEGALSQYQGACKAMDMALVYTFTAKDSVTGVLQSSAAVIDGSGAVVLRQSKPFGTFDAPTATVGVQTVTLYVSPSTGDSDAAVPVTVGVLLGTDVLFMELSRSLMIQNADVILAPLTDAVTAADVRMLGSRAFSHVTAIAAATYADAGGSTIFGFCGLAALPRASRMLWQSTMSAQAPPAAERVAAASEGQLMRGAAPAPAQPGPDENCSPPNSVSGTAEGVAVHSLDLANELEERSVWSIQGDVARKPFQYQPICYADRRRPLDPKAPAPALHDPAGQPVKVKVAMLQMAAINATAEEWHGDRDPVAAHMEKATKFCRDAAAQGADVALFPELWSVGYQANYPPFSPEYPGTHDSRVLFDYMALGTGLNGPYVKHFRRLARELGMAIAATYLEDVSEPVPHGQGAGPECPGAVDTRAPRNSVVVIDRHGEIVYNYAKVHTVIMGATEAVTTSGRGWYSGVLNTRAGADVRVGSIICFDREHDESARGAMLAGTELLLMPTACLCPQWLLDEVSARARENAMPIAMTNYATNNSTGMWWGGNSAGYDHLGELLVVADGQEEIIKMVEFDLTAARAYRATARGHALTHPAPQPELCQLPKVPSFRPQSPDGQKGYMGIAGPGYGAYGRLGDSL